MEIQKLTDILDLFPVRKSKKQKAEFRDAVRTYVQKYGYSAVEEKGSFGAVNLVIGNPESARYLITAHYDTCARLPVPNLITPFSLPLFLLYQIFVALFLIIPAVLLGGIVGWLLNDYLIGYTVWMTALIMASLLVMIGPANKSNVNDNTSGVITLLEIARSLPESLREKVCFVLFDLEEAGLIGSSAYQSKHRKQTKKQMVLNFDCVGDGDYLCLIPTGKLRKNRSMRAALDSICGTHGKKTITNHSKGFAIYPSDQVMFPYGVGICAMNRGKLGHYCSRIHTPKDTILDETNVNILRAAIISMIDSAAAE